MKTGDRVLWIKFVTLNWQLNEWATVIEVHKNSVDIQLDNILVGSNRTPVYSLSVPKYELKDKND